MKKYDKKGWCCLLIVKSQWIPLQLLADQALLVHLPGRHANRAAIEDDLARRRAGWRGEQALSYYLSFLRPERYRIFYDLRLTIQAHAFQIDALLLSPSLAAIIEVKNFTGTVYFESLFDQMIRVAGDRQETFPNPIVQVKRQRDMLNKWLSAHRLPELPIECLVTIANVSTMIKSASNSAGEWVCHAEHLESRLKKYEQRNHKRILGLSALQQLETALLENHTDPQPDVLKKFAVSSTDLIRGVRCPNCGTFEVERAYGTWVCKSCSKKSKDAHVPMILDYFLLKGSTMTNKQCREFLKISDHQLVTRLLRKTPIKIGGSGRGIGQYYMAPPHEYFDQQYQRFRQNRQKRIF
ncbi:NERD domain-containing protein [Sporolactobacillus sp. THM7-7]|nr:NERD domain-containing protein [Sporolactobacillus sp. THM7-7]